MLTPTKAGRYHDKTLFDKETSFRCISPDRTLWLDKGFQGVQRHHKNVMMPKKKPKNAQLTRDEKTENRVISALRMPIEHVFAGLKRMNCLRHVYRNRNGQDDQFIFFECWLMEFECRVQIIDKFTGGCLGFIYLAAFLQEKPFYCHTCSP